MVAAEDGPLRSAAGFALSTPFGLDRLEPADLIAGPACDTLGEVIEWLLRNLDRTVTVEDLASLAAMSPRTFARRLVQETGTTPQRWIIGQRVLLAQQLLELTDNTVDVIADRSGFGNAAALRHHFREWRSTTPNAYRRTFRESQPAGRRQAP